MRIGLTGGIASGKSYVSALIRDHFGIPVVDYDLLTAKAYEDEDVRAKVLDAFGTLDKQAIAEAVFEYAQKRKVLESILHPKINELAKEVERDEVDAHFGATNPHSTGIVVHDIPLLFELGMQGQFEGVIVVSTPEDVRLKRLVKGRGYSEAHALARIHSGASDADRRSIADLIISGVQSADQTIAELSKYFESLGE